MAASVLKVKRPDRWDQPYGQKVSDEQLLEVISHEPFSLVEPNHFPSNRPFELILRNDGRIHQYKAGEILTLQGDSSNSCFLLLSGRLRIILIDKKVHREEKKNQSKKGFWKALKQVLRSQKVVEYRNPDNFENNASIKVDDYGNAVRMIANADKIIKNAKTGEIKSGQFFGEVAALSRSTRTASIFAETDAFVFELKWQGLRDIRLWDTNFRKWVDKLFHQRSFLPVFNKNPLLNQIDTITLQEAADASKFQTYGDQSWYKSLDKESSKKASKELIVGQGQHMDGLLLIRGGFVQATKNYGDGERTDGYLISNELYGLSSLLKRNSASDTEVTSRHNLYALGYVDLLVIPTDIVLKHLIPQWQAAKTFNDKKILKSSAPLYPVDKKEKQLPQALLEILFDERIINGSATMVVDNNACIGCDDCVRACAQAHDNNPRFIRHGIDHSHFTIANACMHCIDPVCLSDCPTGAIHRPPNQGIVQINDKSCIGCANCANSCPYNNIRMVEIHDKNNQVLIDESTQKPLLKATKCDLCVEQNTGPACEQACSHKALKRINFSNRDQVWQWFSKRY
jgi:Fe-S-cluster-containing dehydrogenase component/CRP-like cAMP-binding protein